MEGTVQIFGAGAINPDYERDPVFISLTSANAALKKQVDDLTSRLVFVEDLLVKRLNINFDAAIKEMCQSVKKDKELSKRLEESLRTQNSPNTRKLLEIFLEETSPEEGFIVCNKPLSAPLVNEKQATDDIRAELNYYLGKTKSENLPQNTSAGIQNLLNAPSEIGDKGLNLGYYALSTLKATWIVSSFLYKETLRLGTFLLASTPLILFCILVNELNKLTSGWAFKTAVSGVGMLGSGIGRLF